MDSKMILTVTAIISEAIVVGEEGHAVIARDKFRVLLNEVWDNREDTASSEQ